MSDMESFGGREINLVEDPGKRMFFRKLDFTKKENETQAARRRPALPTVGRWLPETGLVSLPSDVFWCVWQPTIGQSDQTELVVAGDEGVILHRVSGHWKRYQTAERLPVHALHGRREDDLYAVGWMGQVLHFNGNEWRNLRGAQRDDSGKWLASEENTPLFSICGNDEGHVWAVGDSGCILHFDGNDWVRQQSGTTAHLRCVILLGESMVLAAGVDGTLVLGNTQCEDWLSLESGFDGTIQSLLVLDDAVLMAGGEYSADNNRFEGRLVRTRLHVSDRECQLGQCENLTDRINAPRLRHLSQRTPGGPIFIVGDGGYAALLREDTVTELGRIVQHDLLGGTFADDLGLVAIGDFGTLLINSFDTPAADASSESRASSTAADAQPEQALWQRMAVPTRRQLWAVAPDGSGRLCCCGDGGVVLRLSDAADSHWESMGAPTDLSLHCIVGDGHRGFYVGGQMGQIHHHDGKHWSLAFDLQLDITITGFYSPSPDCIFAVGDEGLIVQWDGKQWQRMSSGTKSALYGIWGLDDEHVLAVGDFGLVLRWNGTEWREFNVGTESFLFGVWGDALDNVYVVGLSGTIAHFDGKRWQLTPARARDDLLDLCSFEGQLFSVGVNGLVLRQHNGQWLRESCETDRPLRAVNVSQGRLYAVGDQGQIVERRC